MPCILPKQQISKKKCKNAQNFHNNKPDTIIRDNGKGTCLSINTEISENINFIQQEAGQF
jgi:hypothetical protein